MESEKEEYPNKVRKVQSSLARYCLDKDYKTPRDVSFSNKDALPHYRRLIHNIFEDCLERAFPIAFNFLKGSRWNQMIKDFLAKHHCQSPQIMRTPYEFYLFVKEQFDKDESYRFLIELFYFEWLEIELHIMPDMPPSEFKLSQYDKQKEIEINPEHKLLLLEYPFHRLPPVQAQKKQGEYHLLLFRCPDTGEVNFLQVNPIFSCIIDNLSKRLLSTQELIDLLVELLEGQIENPEVFAQTIEDFIIDLHDKKVIRGFIKN